LNVGGNMNGNTQFLNYWSMWGGYSRDSDGLHVTALRGGPAMFRPAGHNAWLGFNTDDRKRVSFEADGWAFNQWEGLTKSYGVNMLVSCRVASNVNFSLGPTFDYLHDAWSYVTDEAGAGEAH